LTAIDFKSLYLRKPEAITNPERRGGQVVVETHETKKQKERELVTLAAFYSSPRNIPASPMEPDESDTLPHDAPTEIPLPDEVKLRLGIPIAPAAPTPAAVPQTYGLEFSVRQQQPLPQPMPAVGSHSKQALTMQSQQQPPLAPKAWSEGFNLQAGHANQQNERNSARDVRREFRDAVGWSVNETMENGVQQQQQQHQGGSGTGGGRWGREYMVRRCF
jgi:hypothetical protein